MTRGDHKTVLHRISASNPRHAGGPGFDPQQLVPAFTISNRLSQKCSSAICCRTKFAYKYDAADC